MSQELKNAIALIPGIPAVLVEPIADLVEVIIGAPDPQDALNRARYYATADAAKIAADELLRKELG